MHVNVIDQCMLLILAITCHGPMRNIGKGLYWAKQYVMILTEQEQIYMICYESWPMAMLKDTCIE